MAVDMRINDNQAATTIVAASDSLHPERADRVCDGSDDQLTIQAAIDALPTAGGTVLLMDGTFNMADSVGPYGSIYITRNNVVLEGVGDGTILKRAATLTHISIIRFAPDGSGVSNLVFRNFMIDCDNVSVRGIRSGSKSSSNVSLENIHIKNTSSGSASMPGIQIGGQTGYMAHDFRIKNCILENTGGIVANGIENVFIDGCIIKNTAWFGLSAATGCIRTALCVNSVITNNTIDTNSDGGVNGAFANGIDIGYGTQGFVVTGNTVIDVISHSINLQRGTGGGHGVGVISNNIIRNTLYECICVEYDNGQHIIIENNVCDSAEKYGIWVSGGTLATVDPAEIADHINVIGNIVYNCEYGMKLQHVDHARVSDNIIYNIAKSPGIVLYSMQYCDIINNHVEKTCQDGGIAEDTSIYLARTLSGATCHECENNTLIGNHIVEDGVVKPSVAIKLQAVAEVHDNIIRSNIVHGIANQATETSGTATLANGTTSIAVAHGLLFTPAVGDIIVTPIEAWGNMTQFYIDTYTSTQFTIHADQNPTQDVDFAWKAIVL